MNYRTSPVNDDKNVSEQTAMTVDTEGYEERFEDVDRANLIITFFFGSILKILLDKFEGSMIYMWSFCLHCSVNFISELSW